METNDSVLVITYLQEDGTRAFKCRCELGRTYQLLYEKLYQSSYKCIYENFPWDHWVFEDKRDEESFLEAFKWYIIFE